MAETQIEPDIIEDDPPSTSGADVDALQRRRVLTAAQVGLVWGLSEGAVLGLYRTGQLKGVMFGRHLRFRQADVLSCEKSRQPGK